MLVLSGQAPNGVSRYRQARLRGARPDAEGFGNTRQEDQAGLAVQEALVLGRLARRELLALSKGVQTLGQPYQFQSGLLAEYRQAV